MATTKLSFVAADKDKLTIAERWLKKIDAPWMNKETPSERAETGIDRRAVRRMKAAAEDVIQDGSPRLTDLYVFADDSGLYEKRTDDWFIADAESIARGHQEHES
jgi:hypothetical protein